MEISVTSDTPADGGQPVLELDGLSKSFGGLHAVRDVTLKIMPGDRRAIIGPNGAGKTTLFNVITGIFPATSGQVVLYGRDVTRWPSHRRAAAGMARTFQITSLFPKLTVQENFQYAFGKHDMKFGADINAYSTRNNLFFGWSAGSYLFGTLEDFEARQPFAFIQGFGFNGIPYKEAALSAERSYQTGFGFYAQDKWQISRNFTLTYGLRYDGTDNPPARSPIRGERVYSGVEPDLAIAAPPQGPPSHGS